MPAIRVVLWSWCLLALGSGPAGAAPQIVVAADGSGAFTTRDAARASLPPGLGERVVVLVKNGVYTEKVRLDRHRGTLRGESRDGVRLQFHAPRSEYDKRYDRRGPGVLNVFGEDVIVQQMTIENTQTTDGHAFAIYGQPQRFILDDCDVLGVGGDTLSLWNTTYGMYYHRNCRMTGGVDFVCPRGWCFIRDSQFESASTSAALWHDGHMNHDMKFVVRNSRFDGPENFWLGRNHYPAQFYLLDCRFSSRLADKPMGVVTDVSQLPESQQRLYERKYFHNCHREGGDFPWHADNLTGADGAPAPADITAAWTFDGKWDPESAAPPTVVAVEVDDDEVHAYFSEDVAGARQACVVRDDGSIAALTGGDGTRRLEFRCGNAAATPRGLDLGGDDLYGTVATLGHRAVRGG